MKQNNTFYKLILLLLSAVLASVFAQQPPRTMSTVDAELSCICGKESSPYAERVRLIHRLPSNLAPEQVERCRAFLESPLAGHDTRRHNSMKYGFPVIFSLASVRVLCG